MKQLKLENIRKKFDPNNYSGEAFPEEMFMFFETLLTTLSDTVSIDELLFTMQLLINDLEEGKCGFYNSSVTKEKFEQLSSRLDVHGELPVMLSYVPRYINKVAKNPEFARKFSKMFGEEILGQDDIEQLEEDYGYIEVEDGVIDISNKDKAEVLAGLYNNSHPVGMGLAQYDPTPMTVEIARKILEKKVYFDYLLGRPLKINLERDIIRVFSYNRDNGENLAQKVISSCRNINDKGKGKLKKFQTTIEEELQKQIEQEVAKKHKEKTRETTTSTREGKSRLDYLRVSQDEMQPIRRLIEESGYDISEETLEFIKNIENQAYPEEMKLMQDMDDIDELEDIYKYYVPEITIARNNDWYIMYAEDDESVEILDIASSPNRDRNVSRQEMHNYITRVINQKAHSARIPVTLNAKEDTSYRMILRMVNSGEYEILEDIPNAWQTDESIQMHNLVLRPIIQRDRGEIE